MAAYADGVIRGSYKQKWVIKDMQLDTITEWGNHTVIGGIAYYCLKTSDKKLLDVLLDWKKSKV
ncbi:MAG: hypothetical protein EOP34_04110 [Rickettsiales bacterium]|nr:MAG: hypothetical protein EOP34_04110 [Rickettsiales bacterium]